MDNPYDRPPQRTTPPTDFDKAIAAWVRRHTLARGEVEEV